jgi:hypothetical protein
VTTERLDYMPAPWNEAQVAKAIAALERLTEERDRLVDAIEGYLLNEYREGVPPKSCAAELQRALPAREDGPQAEAGGGQGRRSGEGPH